ncbi:MAG: hypothetical protein RI897_4368, partial [Verrucomicrobiota bacterium]
AAARVDTTTLNHAHSSPGINSHTKAPTMEHTTTPKRMRNNTSVRQTKDDSTTRTLPNLLGPEQLPTRKAITSIHPTQNLAIDRLRGPFPLP